MSILASLERAYHRLEKEDKVPPIGYSDERIDYCVVLKVDGQPKWPAYGPTRPLREETCSPATFSSATREAGG